MTRIDYKLRALFAGAFAVALCFALAGCGGSSSASASASGSGSAVASSASEASSEASASSSGVSSSAVSSAASTSSSTSAASVSAASASASAASSSKSGSDTVDQYGNITLYAAMELTGPEFVDLLKGQEYEWSASDKMWQRIYDGAKFAAAQETGVWDEGDYEAATAKGAAASGVAVNVVGGYENSEKALSGNAHCVIEDSYFNENGEGMAIVYGPSMVEHLIIVLPIEESTVEIDIYSKEAVASGMLDEITEMKMGGSFQEAWKNFTGQDSYGH